MKKYLISLFCFLSLSHAWAQNLEIRPIKDLISDIEQAQFTYKETGMIFGFFSIQSCLYVSQDMAIFKNYCFPKKNYPAIGYTILSAKYGMVDIYQEKIDSFIKRDITQTEFYANLLPYLTLPFPESTLGDLSAMMESVYNQYNPACFTTNWSPYSQLPESQCTGQAGEVLGFASWSLETTAITGDDVAWNTLLETVEKKLTP